MHWLDITRPCPISSAERSEYKVTSNPASSKPRLSCSPDCPAPMMAIRFIVNVGLSLFHQLRDCGSGHLGAHGGVATIHSKIGSRDKGSVSRTTEQDCLRYFLRLADAPQQMERTTDFIGFGLVPVGEFVHETAPCPARRDGVDTNFVSGQIHSFVACELNNSCLGYRVEPASGLRYLGADAAEVHHRATASFDHVWMHRLQHHHAADDIDVVTVQPIFACCLECIVNVDAGQIHKK